MSSREFPFEADTRCDHCGLPGAFDLYGDCLCPACIDKFCSRGDGESNHRCSAPGEGSGLTRSPYDGGSAVQIAGGHGIRTESDVG